MFIGKLKTTSKSLKHTIRGTRNYDYGWGGVSKILRIGNVRILDKHSLGHFHILQLGASALREIAKKSGSRKCLVPTISILLAD